MSPVLQSDGHICNKATSLRLSLLCGVLLNSVSLVNLNNFLNTAHTGRDIIVSSTTGYQ